MTRPILEDELTELNAQIATGLTRIGDFEHCIENAQRAGVDTASFQTLLDRARGSLQHQFARRSMLMRACQRCDIR
jgi:hypothetical protein